MAIVAWCQHFASKTTLLGSGFLRSGPVIRTTKFDKIERDFWIFHFNGPEQTAQHLLKSKQTFLISASKMSLVTHVCLLSFVPFVQPGWFTANGKSQKYRIYVGTKLVEPVLEERLD
jgi:hypothetical protein